MKLTLPHNCIQLATAIRTQDIDKFTSRDVLRLSCLIVTAVIGIRILVGEWKSLSIESAGYVAILCGAWLLVILDPPFNVKAFSLIILTYAWGIHNLLFNGIHGEYDAFFTVCIIIAGYTYGQKVGFGTMLFTTVTVFLLPYLNIHFPQFFPISMIGYSDISILSHATGFFALWLGYLCVALLIRHLKVALAEKSVLAADLEETTLNLQNALRRESELAESLRLLLQQEQKKSQNREKLYQEVSHKFRTPLTVISTSSGLLERHSEKMLDSKRNEHYRKIESSIDSIVSTMSRWDGSAENNIWI